MNLKLEFPLFVYMVADEQIIKLGNIATLDQDQLICMWAACDAQAAILERGSSIAAARAEHEHALKLARDAAILRAIAQKILIGFEEISVRIARDPNGDIVHNSAPGNVHNNADAGADDTKPPRSA